MTFTGDMGVWRGFPLEGFGDLREVCAGGGGDRYGGGGSLERFQNWVFGAACICLIIEGLFLAAVVMITHFTNTERRYTRYERSCTELHR